MDVDVLWWLSASSQALVLLRLAWLRVVRRYPFFFCFLAVSVTRSAILLQFDRNSLRYLYTWIYTEPLLLFLMLMAAVEALRRTLEAYPGRRNAVSILLVAFSIAGIVFMVASAGWDSNAVVRRLPLLHAMAIARRALTGSLAIFLLAGTCCLTFLPLPERANVKLHRLLMTIYFGSAAVSQLAINVGLPKAAMNGAALAASILCYTGWLFFSRSGEQEVERPNLTEAEIAKLEAEARRFRDMLRNQ